MAQARAAVVGAASEARLLLLLRSQRERLSAAAIELADTRRQLGASSVRDDLEAPWLAPPSPADTSRSDQSTALADAAGANLRSPDPFVTISMASPTASLSGSVMGSVVLGDDAASACRRDWLAAMAHAI